MGTNEAAQHRAQTMLHNCTFSHWDTGGLKPYMRYSLAGGYQNNVENIYSANECNLSDTRLQLNLTPQQMSADAMKLLMNSPGHRDAIIDPEHARVNIGLAWNRHTFKAVQHFEGNYVRYSSPPAISDGILSFKGALTEPHRFDTDRPLAAMISYAPPPSQLSRGQLAHTYCYQDGEIVAAVAPPSWNPTGSAAYRVTVTQNTCTDPHDVPPDAQRPDNRLELQEHWDRNKARNPREQPPISLNIPVVESREASASQRDFQLSADIGSVLDRHGPGVYTVTTLASLRDDSNPVPIAVSEHSIFHLTEPPPHDFRTTKGARTID